MAQNKTLNKERIVILGGGVAAMTAAWELTNQPDWQSRYDITVYHGRFGL